MKVREWQELNLPIEWGIYSTPRDIRDITDIEDWDLDLTTDLPDGVYKVKASEGFAEGITVSNGEFVPRPTAIALYEAVRQDYEGTKSFEKGGSFGQHADDFPEFVESIIWNGSYFEVDTGH